MDLIVTDAKVVTMDANDTKAQALAIQDGKIVAVGCNDDIMPLRGPKTPHLHARGATVLPGFIEPHNHMVGFGTALLGVDVCTPPNRTMHDIVERLRQRAVQTPPGQWILGRGYDDTAIPDMRHPTRHDLDAASTQHPIVIWHNSGHLLVANSRALDLAGIRAETPDPAGGHIGRFPASAEPDGVLYEMPAQALVTSKLPPYPEADVRHGFLQAQEAFLRAGVTTIHDALVGRMRGVDILRTYQQMRRAGDLKLRINMFLQWQLLRELDFALQSGFGDAWLRVAGCKIVADGSIQGITAALREPYYCHDDQQGWLIYEQDELNDMVLTLHRQGYQIATHANGDAAIDAVLTAYGKALRQLPRSDHRFRIEHCQVCHPEHIQQMWQLGVIPNFFANHVYYWGDRHRDLFLGPERVQFLDPVGSALRAGMHPLLHSDCPVTPVSPLFCVQSATARLTRSGQVLNAPERIAVREALATMTVNAAYGAFEEQAKGTLEVGKLGDLVVLTQDPFLEAPQTLGQIEVAATVVGGQVMVQTDAVDLD
ncbi:N-substituted formamide deformylase [Candidatus Entotheonellaceae bacterium PAL068K]